MLGAGRTAPSARRAAPKRPTISKFRLRDLQLGEEELLARDLVSIQFEGLKTQCALVEPTPDAATHGFAFALFLDF